MNADNKILVSSDKLEIFDHVFGDLFESLMETEANSSDQIGRISTMRAYIREYVRTTVPSYWLIVPSSASGLHHPKFSQGQQGVLRHSRMAALVAKNLCQLNEFNEVDPLIAVCACILHDTYKYGYDGAEQHAVYAHPSIAAEEFYNWFIHYHNNKTTNSSEDDEMLHKDITEICKAIHSHMGQWHKDFSSSTSKVSKTEQLVHLADYIASRKFFDDSICHEVQINP